MMAHGVLFAERGHRKGEKIVTDYWRKPGPTDKFDWCAYFDNDEPNDNGSMMQGYGRTESDAVDDLLRLAEEMADWESAE